MWVHFIFRRSRGHTQSSAAEIIRRENSRTGHCCYQQTLPIYDRINGTAATLLCIAALPTCTLVNHWRRLLLLRLLNLMRLTIFDSCTRTCITTMVYSKGSIVLTHCPMSPLLLSRYHDKGKHVNGIEPSSSAWKADILTIVRHMRA